MYVRRILRQPSSAMENPAGDLLSPVPPRTVAVVGLPRPDEKSLAGTRCMSASDHPIAIDSSSLNDMTVFRPGVRGLSRAGQTSYTRSGDSLTLAACRGLRTQGLRALSRGRPFGPAGATRRGEKF